MTKIKNIYYGWIILFCCMLLAAASTGILSYFSALFVAPVTQSLGISRASFMMYSTIASIVTMLFMPAAGILFKKISLKLLLAIGALCCSLALLTYSFSHSLAGFYAGGVLAGFGMCLCGAIPLTTLLSNWFIKKRGLVIGIAFAGSAIMPTLFSPLLSNIIANMGWRFAYRTLAAALFIMIIVVALPLIKVTPAEKNLKPYGLNKEHEQNEYNGKNQQIKETGTIFTMRQVLAMPAFWFFAAAVFFIGVITPGTQQHLAAYWISVNITAGQAAAFYSIVMFVSIFAKILTGSMFDRLSVKHAVIICGLIFLSAFISLNYCVTWPVILVPIILFGYSTSFQVIIPTCLSSKFFGDELYSSVFGIINTALFLGVSVGVSLSGFFYDTYATYEPAWKTYAVLALVSLSFLLLANSNSIKNYQNKLNRKRQL